MTEKELYERTVAVSKTVNGLIDAVMEMDATIELCVFTGKLGAVSDILMVLEDSGIPVPDPGEEPHLLEEKPS